MNKKLDAALQMTRALADRLRDTSLAGAKVAVRTRLWDEAPKFARRDLLQMALREGVNVGNMHAVHARANPERLALVDAQHAWDFVETNDKINQVCHAFEHIVRNGERPRVVLCMENRVEYALVWFALFRLGWPAVHASNGATVEELKYLFERSEPLIAVGSEKTRARLEAAATPECTVLSADAPTGDTSTLFLHDYIAGFARTHYQRSRAASGENVVFTSGTTGKPKGAVRDFGAMGVFELIEVLERMPISLQERHLVVSKLYHSAGQAFTLIMAALGATIFIEDVFEPEQLLRSIHENNITSLFMVPTMIARVLRQDDAVFAKYPPNELRAIVSGAGLFKHALRERAIARFGADTIYDFYGASELGWVTLISGTEMLERQRSQGRPLRGQEIRIVDADADGEKVLPPNQVGLIQVRTQTRMEGYLGDEASSDEILSPDGWMTVDDTGYLDEDGYLYLAGRARDMVISGGVNIYPAETEEVLSHHPDIREVSVVGAPDEEWGEKLVGFVASSKPLAFDDLETWARGHVAGYKIPRVWYEIDSLPRNPTGKVLKKDLEVVARGDGVVGDDASDVAKDVAQRAKKAVKAAKGSKKNVSSKTPAAPKKSAKKPAAKKAAAKKPAEKKAPTKKSAKKSGAKDSAASKTATKKKSAAKKKTSPKKTATKKSVAKASDTAETTSTKTTKKAATEPAAKKKPAPQKAASKKSAAKKPAPKKAASKKPTAKKTASAKKASTPRTPKKARSPRASARQKDS